MQIECSFEDIIYEPLKALRDEGLIFKSKSWQGINNPPSFLEVINLQVQSHFYFDEGKLRDVLNPNDWALEHIEERLSGEPSNPPNSHVKWAANNQTSEYLSKVDPERFSHTYQERLWFKALEPYGHRFKNSDLMDAAKLLKKDPETRQCYIPMFFSEDLTAALEEERVPCSFGWHYMIRDNHMNINYNMRSCDALRHFHHDIYFAIRKAKWLLDQAELAHVEAGIISFSATSFHCFENDQYALNQKISRLEL